MIDVILIDNHICKLKQTPHGDYLIEPPQGFHACRMINGKPCGCTNTTMTEKGTCGCAPNDHTNKVVILPNEKVS